MADNSRISGAFRGTPKPTDKAPNPYGARPLSEGEAAEYRSLTGLKPGKTGRFGETPTEIAEVDMEYVGRLLSGPYDYLDLEYGEKGVRWQIEIGPPSSKTKSDRKSVPREGRVCGCPASIAGGSAAL